MILLGSEEYVLDNPINSVRDVFVQILFQFLSKFRSILAQPACTSALTNYYCKYASVYQSGGSSILGYKDQGIGANLGLAHHDEIFSAHVRIRHRVVRISIEHDDRERQKVGTVCTAECLGVVATVPLCKFLHDSVDLLCLPYRYQIIREFEDCGLLCLICRRKGNYLTSITDFRYSSEAIGCCYPRIYTSYLQTIRDVLRIHRLRDQLVSQEQKYIY